MILALLCCAVSLAAVIALFPSTRDGRVIHFQLLPWDGPLAFVLHVDALSMLFALMGTAIGGIVLLYSIGYMADDPSATRFYALMLTFIGGLLGLVFSANLFLLYAFWELVGLCSFGLVGFWYRNPEAVSGARKVLLMTHLAGYGLLASILLIYRRTGSALWTDPAVTQAFTGGLFVLMLLALVAKSVQFPLHTWIPEAMAAPTPVSALLHAACYVKAGVYLAARMHSFGPWNAEWSTLMVSVGTATMLAGAIYAMVQKDLKRMLAFSTVSQIGYMITGIGIGTPLAITAALLHCLNHGFFKGGLFLAAGSVQHAAGTRDMDQLGGLAQKMPRTATAWMISMGCMMGVPLMSGFASKWMLYTAALEAGLAIPALVAWLASVATVFYCAKATGSVFLGPCTERTEHAHEAPPTMQWALGLIAAGSVVLSVAPQIAVNYILNPVLAALGLASGVQVTWFGLLDPVGTWWVTGGLVLAVVSVAAGGLIYMLMGRSSVVLVAGGAGLAGAGGGVFTGGEPLSGDGRLPASDFSEILRAQLAPVLRWTNVDRCYLAGWGVLQTLALGLAKITSWAERAALPLTLALGAVLLASLRWLAPPVTPSGAEALGGIPSVLAICCTLACIALCASSMAYKATRRFTPLMVLSGGAAVAGLFVTQAGPRLALMELAGVLAVVMIWQFSDSPGAKWTYLSIFATSGAAIVAGDLLLHNGGDPQWARALLVTGFLVKLAAIPLFLWLLSLAEAVPGLLLGLIVAVLDIAAFGELYFLAQNAPWIVEPRGLWIGLGIASAVGGSLLMLAQKDIKRLLVLSSVEDVGFLLLAIASVGPLGASAALMGAAVHALAKGLLFITVGAPDAEAALRRDGGGLASLYPLRGAGFLVGMLAMLGVPPTLGFAARWRLYATAAESGPLVLSVFLISSALALVAYALALTRIWWGPPPDAPPSTASAVPKPSLPLQLVVLGLILVLLMGGLWPQAFESLMGGVR